MRSILVWTITSEAVGEIPAVSVDSVVDGVEKEAISEESVED